MPEQDEAVRLLFPRLEALRDHGYEPMYNGRPSCPFCLNFIDDEETHTPGCLLVDALATPPPADEAEPWEGDTGEHSGTNIDVTMALTNIQVAPDYEQAARDHSWPDTESSPAASALDVEPRKAERLQVIASGLADFVTAHGQSCRASILGDDDNCSCGLSSLLHEVATLTGQKEESNG